MLRNSEIIIINVANSSTQNYRQVDERDELLLVSVSSLVNVMHVLQKEIGKKRNGDRHEQLHENSSASISLEYEKCLLIRFFKERLDRKSYGNSSARHLALYGNTLHIICLSFDLFNVN